MDLFITRLLVSDSLACLTTSTVRYQNRFISLLQYDLELALSNGVYVNADNDHELVYIDELLASTCKNTSSRIGLRINPIVGSGAIPIVSTATKQSKFGLPVANDTRDKVLALYDKYQWLSGIHVHVGSQGVPMELFVQGVKVNH